MIDGEIFANEKLTAGLIRTANGIYYLFGDNDDQNYNEDLFSYIKRLLKNREEIYIVHFEQRMGNDDRSVLVMYFGTSANEISKCNL